MTEPFEPDPYIAATRTWLTRAVLGLNLCPFAAAPYRAGLVHIVASDAQGTEQLLEALATQMLELARMPAEERETTLLVHPLVMHDFLEFNDFLDTADGLLAQLDLEGTLQVASFHPDYLFADASVDDAANATNRSPYPTLHLLREASVSRAVDSTDTTALYERNIRTLRELGAAGWARLWCGE